MESLTIKALDFLAERNVLNEYLNQVEYVSYLMEFMDTHGEEAIQKLAGFYIYAIEHLDQVKQDRAIVGTFAHDLGGRNDKFMLPRSDNYLKYWLEEMEANDALRDMGY